MDLNKENIVRPEDEERYKFEAAIASLNVDNRELKKKALYWQQQADLSMEKLTFALALQQGRQVREIIPRERKGQSETTAILQGTDWHSGETVELKTMNALNEYNTDVEDQRVDNYYHRSGTVIDLWRSGTTIKNLVWHWGGDLVNGYIHEEFLENNYLSPTEACLKVQNNLEAGINFFLKEVGIRKIQILANFGNHSRTGKVIKYSTAYKNSFEWLMYHNIQKMFKDNRKIEFQIADGYFIYHKIYGRDFRFHHGDYFNYREGIGGIAIPVQKAVLSWSKGHQVYMDIFGHWHQAKDYQGWISGGSLIGYNNFCLKIKAVYEPPSQQLIFIEKDHGKTAVLPIYV